MHRDWPKVEEPFHAALENDINLRIVLDPSSATGWELDVGPFPGWKDVPTW